MSGEQGLPEFVTVADVARVLRLNPQTVRNWIDAGRLPVVRFGRRVRIRREDFERLTSTGLRLDGPDPGAGIGGLDAAAFWRGEYPPDRLPDAGPAAAGQAAGD